MAGSFVRGPDGSRGGGRQTRVGGRGWQSGVRRILALVRERPVAVMREPIRPFSRTGAHGLRAGAKGDGRPGTGAAIVRRREWTSPLGRPPILLHPPEPPVPRTTLLLAALALVAACSDGLTVPENPDGLVFEPTRSEFVGERPVLTLHNGTDRPLSYHACADASLLRRDDDEWIGLAAKPADVVCTDIGPAVLQPGDEYTIRPFYPMSGDGTYRFVLDAIWGGEPRRIASGAFRIEH